MLAALDERVDRSSTVLLTDRQHSRLPLDDDPSLPETHFGVRDPNRLDPPEAVFSLVAGLQGVVGFDSPELADVSRNNPLRFTDPWGLQGIGSGTNDPRAAGIRYNEPMWTPESEEFGRGLGRAIGGVVKFAIDASPPRQIWELGQHVSRVHESTERGVPLDAALILSAREIEGPGGLLWQMGESFGTQVELNRTIGGDPEGRAVLLAYLNTTGRLTGGTQFTNLHEAHNEFFQPMTPGRMGEDLGQIVIIYSPAIIHGLSAPRAAGGAPQMHGAAGPKYTPLRAALLEEAAVERFSVVPRLARADVAGGVVYEQGTSLAQTAVPEGQFIWVQTSPTRFLFAERLFGQGFPRLPHPLLSRGAPVLAAGEGIGEGGVIVYINRQSGHFRPNAASLQGAINALREQGRFGEVVIIEDVRGR